MSKRYEGHESCPQCGSKDNVAIWSDGQKWCFGGCGYYIPGNSGLSMAELRTRLSPLLNQEEKNGSVYLPFDFSLAMPGGPVKWLRQYGITDEERFRFKLGWSEFFESLIFPIFNQKGKLELLQRRSFNPMRESRKYITRGPKESVIWSAKPYRAESSIPDDTLDGTLVVVEDMVSAIKVGRKHEAMPLWGSDWSMDKLNKVANRWDEVILWLDPNKVGHAIMMRKEAELFFNKVHVVVTDRDPKCYEDKEIDAILADATRSSG